MLCYDNISSSILAARVASYSAPCTEIPGQNKLLMTAAKYFIQLDIYFAMACYQKCSRIAQYHFSITMLLFNFRQQIFSNIL